MNNTNKHSFYEFPYFEYDVNTVAVVKNASGGKDEF